MECYGRSNNREKKREKYIFKLFCLVERREGERKGEGKGEGERDPL